MRSRPKISVFGVKIPIMSNDNYISAGAYMAIVMQEQAAANAFALAAAGKKKRKWLFWIFSYVYFMK